MEYPLVLLLITVSEVLMVSLPLLHKLYFVFLFVTSSLFVVLAVFCSSC